MKPTSRCGIGWKCHVVSGIMRKELLLQLKKVVVYLQGLRCMFFEKVVANFRLGDRWEKNELTWFLTKVVNIIAPIIIMFF